MSASRREVTVTLKFSSEESITGLKQAKAREHESAELYGKCLAEATNESTKEILQMLVDEEKKHYSIVSRLVEDAEKNRAPSVETGETATARETIEKAFKHISLSDFSAEKASVDNLLEKALDNERESFNLYSILAAESESNETKAVYQYLADQENKHYVMVSNLLNFLGNPGRWLYEEENLIFRR
jgi:Ni,Fe-hydrogenase III component G